LKSKPHTQKGVFNIWHFSLDDVNIEDNYGVYANGLLVEACPYADMIKILNSQLFLKNRLK